MLSKTRKHNRTERQIKITQHNTSKTIKENLAALDEVIKLKRGGRIYAWNKFYKCKSIFTKMLKDVGMEVPKSIETRSKFSIHADKGRG